MRVPSRLIRVWYDYLSRLDRSASMTVLNYGYEDGQRIDLAGSPEAERYRLQLYHHVARGMDLRGKRVLEIGSGRGGGAAFLARSTRPAHYCGLDFSSVAVAFCRQHYRVPGLSFLAGDAQHLPFDSGAFDAVINIESSHCYPDLAAFLAEVSRVLGHGGCFLYADFRRSKDVPAWRKQLGAGFEVLNTEDITTQVVAALEADNANKEATIKKHVPFYIRRPFRRFAGMRNTPIYRAFDEGASKYFCFTFRKRQATER